MDAECPESVYRIFSHVTRFHFHRIHTLLEPLGIHPGQPPLLFVLEREEGISQKELARKLHIRPATLTVMLRRMENNGWVRRSQDPEDQRVSRVYLTEEGKQLSALAKSRVRTMESVLFQGFTEGELDDLRRLLGRVRENLLALEKQPEDAEDASDKKEKNS